LEIFFVWFYKDVAPTALGCGASRNGFNGLLDSVRREQLAFPINFIQFPTK
jgi:hypothetical protein